MELPSEIWSLITANISLRDTLNLRACDRVTLNSLSTPLLNQYLAVVRYSNSYVESIYSRHSIKMAFKNKYNTLIKLHISHHFAEKRHGKYIMLNLLSGDMNTLKSKSGYISWNASDFLRQAVKTNAFVFKTVLKMCNIPKDFVRDTVIPNFAHTAKPDVFDYIIKTTSRWYNTTYYKLIRDVDFQSITSLELAQHLIKKYSNHFRYGYTRNIKLGAAYRGDIKIYTWMELNGVYGAYDKPALICLKNAIMRNNYKGVKSFIMDLRIHDSIAEITRILEVLLESKYRHLSWELITHASQNLGGCFALEEMIVLIESAAYFMTGSQLLKLINLIGFDADGIILKNIEILFTNAYQNGNNKLANWLIMRYRDQPQVFPQLLRICVTNSGSGSIKPVIFNILLSGNIGLETLNICIDKAIKYKLATAIEECIIYRYELLKKLGKIKIQKFEIATKI